MSITKLVRPITFTLSPIIVFAYCYYTQLILPADYIFFYLPIKELTITYPQE